MANFLRVYASMPSIEEITKIEGPVIVDATPSGPPQGVSVGVVALVGEYTDMRYATVADKSTGAISTRILPQVVFSAADFQEKFGGFDETLGRFGGAMGNGYIAVKNKVFAAESLIPVAVNLCSAYGVRLWRKLPTCKSATDPTPVTPLQASRVPAGTEFRLGQSRVRLGTRVDFSASVAINEGTDGVVTSSGLAASHTFTSASGDFLGGIDALKLLRKGDILVLGALGGAGAVLDNADTYRLTGAPTSVAGNSYGTVIVPASNQNGLRITAKVLGVTVTIVVRAGDTTLAVPAVVGKAVIINVATTAGASISTATEVAAAILAEPTAAALITGTALGTGNTVVTALSINTLDNGALALTALAPLVSIKFLQTGTGTTLDAAVLPGTNQVLVTLATDGNGLSTTTGTLLKAKLDAVPSVAALISSAQVGSGAGLVAPTADYAALPYGNQLTVEKLDGSSFDWTTGTAQPWRVHAAACADTGEHNALADAGGYIIPARPLDATVASATLLGPRIAVPAGTATYWEPLAGLTMRTHSGQPLTYTAAVQAPNVANSATVDALYDTAIDALLGDAYPVSTVSLVVAARKSATIRSKLRAHALVSTANGRSRAAIISPALDTLSVNTVVGDADPGVGALRNERVWYCWPPVRTQVPEAVGFTIATSDGQTTVDGSLDTSADEWMASLLSQLAPERSPGQSTDPVPTSFNAITDFARGVPALGAGEYQTMRKRGVCGFRITSDGVQFQSAVTTSTVSGEKDINRRRFADYVELSTGKIVDKYTKEPLSQSIKDAAEGDLEAFLGQLTGGDTSPLNERINGYSLDTKSLNSPALEEQGIFVFGISVRMLPIANNIVLACRIGPGVKLS